MLVWRGLCGVLRRRRLKPVPLKSEERERAGAEHWRLCCGVTWAQAGLPVLLEGKIRMHNSVVKTDMLSRRQRNDFVDERGSHATFSVCARCGRLCNQLFIALAGSEDEIASGLPVWAGDEAQKGNDFLAVIDADPSSASYGHLVTTLATDQQTERAHHTEYTMPSSGMLFANDHDSGRTFIFDVRDPVHPKIATSFTDMAGYMHPIPTCGCPTAMCLPRFSTHTTVGATGRRARRVAWWRLMTKAR